MKIKHDEKQRAWANSDGQQELNHQASKNSHGRWPGKIHGYGESNEHGEGDADLQEYQGPVWYDGTTDNVYSMSPKLLACLPPVQQPICDSFK